MEELYIFRKDLFQLIEELKIKSNILEANKILQTLLKEDKHPIYALTRRSKLLLDKSRFKPNFTIPQRLTLDIYLFNLEEISKNPEIFDRLVMIDKKNNFLKQVGGIPLKPVRDLAYHVVLYNTSPFITTDKTNISINMKATKMTDRDLAFMQKIMAAVRFQTDIGNKI